MQSLSFRVRRDHTVLLLALIVEVQAARAPTDNFVLFLAVVTLELDGAGGEDMVEVPTVVAMAEVFRGVMKGVRWGVRPAGTTLAIFSSVSGSLCHFELEAVHLL